MIHWMYCISIHCHPFPLFHEIFTGRLAVYLSIIQTNDNIDRYNSLDRHVISLKEASAINAGVVLRIRYRSGVTQGLHSSTLDFARTRHVMGVISPATEENLN
jgi:hypothetical protein